MSEHLRCIEDKECFDTYLRKDNIQNEMIWLISNRILKIIVSSVKAENYFSVIMDYTPYRSYKEQLSILMHCVKINKKKLNLRNILWIFAYHS
jgi:hypothetical protein